MDLGLNDRAVLVTGSTGVLGTAVVRAFLEAGARVTASWISERERDALVQALGSNVDVRFEHADVTDPAAVSGLVAAASQAAGRLDVLAHLVGGFAMDPVGETETDTWHKMVAINATSAFMCAREAVRRMRPNGWGRIVTVGSVPAVDRGASNMAAYAASKAAVVSLTQSLAKEVVAHGITVNSVIPTTIDSPANRAAMPNAKTGTWLPPQAIAKVIVWLASEPAAIVTGTAVMLAKG